MRRAAEIYREDLSVSFDERFKSCEVTCMHDNHPHSAGDCQACMQEES